MASMPGVLAPPRTWRPPGEPLKRRLSSALPKAAIEQRGEDHVLVSGVDQVGVDLVGDDDQVVPERELGQPLELGAAEGATRRVVRVAEQEEPGARVDRAFEPVEVDLEAIGAGHERVLDQASARGAQCPEEGRVDRRLNDGAFPLLGVRDQRDEHALYHVGHHVDLARLQVPAEALLHALAEQRRQTVRRRVDRVAEVPAPQHQAQLALDRLGRGEVHVGHPRRQHLGTVEVPLLAATVAQPFDAEGVQVGKRAAQLCLGLAQGRAQLEPVDRLRELETGAFQIALEVATELLDGPADRILQRLEARDLIPARWVVMEVGRLLEAVEAQPLARLVPALEDPQRAPSVARSRAVLHAKMQRPEITFPHGAPL
jgi:hypothetical protein